MGCPLGCPARLMAWTSENFTANTSSSLPKGQLIQDTAT